MNVDVKKDSYNLITAIGKNKALAPCENSEYSQSRQNGHIKSGASRIQTGQKPETQSKTKVQDKIKVKAMQIQTKFE